MVKKERPLQQVAFQAPSSHPQVSLTQHRKRRKQTAVCCPVAYGSIAFRLKKGSEFHTHEWTLFVRGPRGEDVSYFLDKVVFKLHPSFARPIREVTKPPFEVTEQGWGEFEAAIRLHFKDPTERPVELAHVVKLYAGNQAASEDPVSVQIYDEVVFSEPYEDFYEQLEAAPFVERTTEDDKKEKKDASLASVEDAKKKKKQKVEESSALLDKRLEDATEQRAHALTDYFESFDDAQDLEVMLRASDYIKSHLDAVKDSIYRLDHQITVCKQIDQNRHVEAQKLRQAQAQHQAQRAAQQQKQPSRRDSSSSNMPPPPPAQPPSTSTKHQHDSRSNLQPAPAPMDNNSAAAAAAYHHQAAASQPVTLSSLGGQQQQSSSSKQQQQQQQPRQQS